MLVGLPELKDFNVQIFRRFAELAMWLHGLSILEGFRSGVDPAPRPTSMFDVGHKQTHRIVEQIGK
jgi:hypothetical protein